jgi:hypothetical protein
MRPGALSLACRVVVFAEFHKVEEKSYKNKKWEEGKMPMMEELGGLRRVEVILGGGKKSARGSMSEGVTDVRTTQ